MFPKKSIIFSFTILLLCLTHLSFVSSVLHATHEPYLDLGHKGCNICLFKAEYTHPPAHPVNLFYKQILISNLFLQQKPNTTILATLFQRPRSPPKHYYINIIVYV